MKDIIKQNYEVTRQRGLINDKTSHYDFQTKIIEEVNELLNEYRFYDFKDTTNLFKEVSDVILTCFNYLKHYNIDIEQILKEKIEINRKRIKP